MPLSADKDYSLARASSRQAVRRLLDNDPSALGCTGLVRGANAIIALRCCQMNGRWEEFWENRSAKTS